MSRSIIIVGGGASGLVAAVFCGRRIGGHNVTVLEKQPRVGKKLLATGNGTCNISNIHASCEYYHGADARFVNKALTAFTPYDAMDFFASVGVRCVVREDGRVYPLCAQASAVLDCLREELAALGVCVLCDTAVTAIKPTANGVEVICSDAVRKANAVLLAAGGAASASLGGSTDAYTLAQALGHTKTPLFPAIVQIRTQKEAVRSVKGIRLDAALTLRHDERVVACSQGEILFADYGVSGPAAMAIGRYAADWERRKAGAMCLSMDLLPMLSEQEVSEEIRRRMTLSGRTLETVLTGLLHKKLGQTIVKNATGLALSTPVSDVNAKQMRAIAAMLKRWDLEVTGCAGMNAAQVTAGGISTKEIDPQTMRSKRVPSVYILGEMMDIDGDCGGFNLQWAWSSAYAAATAATEG